MHRSGAGQSGKIPIASEVFATGLDREGCRAMPKSQSVWLQDDNTQSNSLSQGEAFTPAAFLAISAMGFPARRQPNFFGNAGFFTPRLSDNVVTTRQNPAGLTAIRLQKIYN